MQRPRTLLHSQDLQEIKSRRKKIDCIEKNTAVYARGDCSRVFVSAVKNVNKKSAVCLHYWVCKACYTDLCPGIVPETTNTNYLLTF